MSRVTNKLLRAKALAESDPFSESISKSSPKERFPKPVRSLPLLSPSDLGLIWLALGCKPSFREVKAALTDSGVVYAITDGDFVKIGYTALQLDQRLSGLQVGNPRDLTLLWAIRGGEEIEAWLHERFQHLHVRGEWFHLTDEIRNVGEEG